MTTRGLNFLHEWISNNVPETATADVVSVDELTHKLIADAKAVVIRRDEIDDEVDSIYRTLVDAIVHFDPGLPESARGRFGFSIYGL
ncbi:DUF768 domain-containing protein [Mesorhizobium loti]|uniref:DUF768 domain-containing protein n=1 Tax=Rhizobium loti TaxID=381 RepID=UPI00041C5E03|nr:DUF768 domain-containing protein [Mesorhizobium loti]